MTVEHNDLYKRYNEKDFEGRGNVSIICLLEHIKTKKRVVVTNTHIFWNPKLDFVKYGQANWLLYNLATFIKKNDIDLNQVCVIMCGDFNSKPDSSVVHRIMNKEYLLTEATGRTHPVHGLKAYQNEEGRRILDKINQDI